MAVTRLDILDRAPYEGGRAFDGSGAYERIDAIAHYALDPAHAANQGIVDLDLAERGDDGLVRFSGDVTILQPMAAEAGNGTLLLQVPNRGRRQLARFNMTAMETADTAEIAPGDGFLFRHGWTVCWGGWQWDVPRTPDRARVGLTAPQVPVTARTPQSRMQLRFQTNRPMDELALTDQHVGDLGRHSAIPPLKSAESEAELLVRDAPYGEAEPVPRARWRFVDDSRVALEGGFQPGRIYDLLYTPRDGPVVGAGLLATRDLATFLRHDDGAPTAGRIARVIGEGQSQCGRFLRTLLHLGLNRDEDGKQAFDGVLAHIAGGRRGEFNHRYGQPSVQPTPSFGHLFPFYFALATPFYPIQVHTVVAKSRLELLSLVFPRCVDVHIFALGKFKQYLIVTDGAATILVEKLKYGVQFGRKQLYVEHCRALVCKLLFVQFAPLERTHVSMNTIFFDHCLETRQG